MDVDTNTVQELIQDARNGNRPLLTKQTAHEIQYLLDAYQARKKIFDPALYSNLIEMDVFYEGNPLRPSEEKVTISFGAAGMTRQIRIPAGLLFGFVELLQEAVPED